MNMTRLQAVACGTAAVVGVAALQAFNSFACYKHDIAAYAKTLLFIGIPMLPALFSLATRIPLRAVGASLFFAPWLPLAYYTDCIRPYEGGGASMIYVAVVLWGLPSALVGALVTGPVLRKLKIAIV